MPLLPQCRATEPVPSAAAASTARTSSAALKAEPAAEAQAGQGASGLRRTLWRRSKRRRTAATAPAVGGWATLAPPCKKLGASARRLVRGCCGRASSARSGVLTGSCGCWPHSNNGVASSSVIARWVANNQEHRCFGKFIPWRTGPADTLPCAFEQRLDAKPGTQSPLSFLLLCMRRVDKAPKCGSLLESLHNPRMYHQ
jgi:hypothetical protein